MLAKRPVVKIIDSTKDITSTTDTSEHSISGILSQEVLCDDVFRIDKSWIELFKHWNGSFGNCIDEHKSPSIFNWKKISVNMWPWTERIYIHFKELIA